MGGTDPRPTVPSLGRRHRCRWAATTPSSGPLLGREELDAAVAPVASPILRTVDAAATLEEVGPRPADHAVVAGPAHHEVGAIPADDQVVAGPPEDRVVTRRP